MKTIMTKWIVTRSFYSMLLILLPSPAQWVLNPSWAFYAIALFFIASSTLWPQTKFCLTKPVLTYRQIHNLYVLLHLAFFFWLNSIFLMSISGVTWSHNSIADGEGNTAQWQGEASFVSWRGWQTTCWVKAQLAGSEAAGGSALRIEKSCLILSALPECFLGPSCPAELTLWLHVDIFADIFAHSCTAERQMCVALNLRQGRYPSPVLKSTHSPLGLQPEPNGRGGRPIGLDISQSSCAWLLLAGLLSWHPQLQSFTVFQKPTPNK